MSVSRVYARKSNQAKNGKMYEGGSFFQVQCVKDWNKLPKELRETSTMSPSQKRLLTGI